MSEKIKPALTPQQWREWFDLEASDFRGHGIYVLEHQPGIVEQVAFNYADGIQIQANDEDNPPRVDFGVRDRHALAALALHGQPFGFTREDVATLRECAQQQRDISIDHEAAVYAGDLGGGPELDSLADRIEALLPPTMFPRGTMQRFFNPMGVEIHPPHDKES